MGWVACCATFFVTVNISNDRNWICVWWVSVCLTETLSRWKAIQTFLTPKHKCSTVLIRGCSCRPLQSKLGKWGVMYMRRPYTPFADMWHHKAWPRLIQIMDCRQALTRCSDDLLLQWSHNGHDGVSNHQPYHCLLTRLFSADQKKYQSSASLALVQGIHRRPAGEFPAQMASNAENVSIWWRHHVIRWAIKN